MPEIKEKTMRLIVAYDIRSGSDQNDVVAELLNNAEVMDDPAIGKAKNPRSAIKTVWDKRTASAYGDRKRRVWIEEITNYGKEIGLNKENELHEEIAKLKGQLLLAEKREKDKEVAHQKEIDRKDAAIAAQEVATSDWRDKYYSAHEENIRFRATEEARKELAGNVA